MGCVTEDEESVVPVADCLVMGPEIGEEQQPRGWLGWRGIMHRLTWVGQRGDIKPSVGQICLVMKGKVGEDEGQMAVITGTRKVMVEIAWKSDAAGRHRRKLKQPQSLVMLEEGLVVQRASDGSVWIRRTRRADVGG